MWKESYRVGVDLIDTQHQELFHRVSDFLQAIKSDGEWEQKVAKVKETSDFMQNYVIEHFSAEEAFQQSIHYDQYEKHHQVRQLLPPVEVRACISPEVRVTFVSFLKLGIR